MVVGMEASGEPRSAVAQVGGHRRMATRTPAAQGGGAHRPSTHLAIDRATPAASSSTGGGEEGRWGGGHRQHDGQAARREDGDVAIPLFRQGFQKEGVQHRHIRWILQVVVHEHRTQRGQDGFWGEESQGGPFIIFALIHSCDEWEELWKEGKEKVLHLHIRHPGRTGLQGEDGGSGGGGAG